MPAEPTQAPVRTMGNGATVFDLPANLTDASESTLTAIAVQASRERPSAVILNLSGVRHMDSSGLGHLMTLVTRARRQGRSVLAYGLSESLQHAFALTHLDEAVGVYETESKALAASRAPAAPRPATPAATSTPMADPNWARPLSRLKAPPLPPEAVNLNVDGRRLLSPLDGFGPMARKTYSIRLSGASVTPTEVVKTWKEHFASFWPKGNGFFGPSERITAGDTAVLNLSLMGPLKLHTGVHVIYADDTSFCFMTPQGHMFGGLITFSAHDDRGVTVVQVQPLIRPSDPFYDLTLRLGIGGAIEDAFWRQSLKNLAAHFGVEASAQQQAASLDRAVQWSKAGNIWYNAAIRTTFYALAAPLRWLRRIATQRQT